MEEELGNQSMNAVAVENIGEVFSSALIVILHSMAIDVPKPNGVLHPSQERTLLVAIFMAGYMPMLY